jgi:tetratricopeptide (TPR) repeat protein
MDDYNEQHQELLNRFSTALRKGGAEAWFDEDEIVSIFDYAGDIGNDYLRAEALMWGARYFPDSDLLRERKCIFYNDVLGESAVISFAQNNQDKHTFVTDLLLTKASDINGEKALNFLNSLLQTDKRFEDEEIIQIVNFAFETNNKKWMYEHVDDMRKHTDFLPSLLFEVAASAYEQGDFDKAIPLLEELVGESPYSIDYWDMLSKAYFTVGREKEAYDALEMTLAIDPNFLPALQTKAYTLVEAGKYKEIEQIQRLYPDDMEIAEAHLKAMLVAYKDNIPEKMDEIVDTLLINNDVFPQSDLFFDYLLMFAPQKAKHAVSTHWDNVRAECSFAEATSRVFNLMDILVTDRKFDGALVVVEHFFSINDPDYVDFELTSELRKAQAILYFITRQWEKAYNTIFKYRNQEMNQSYIIAVAEVMCLVKMNRLDEARDLAFDFVRKRGEYSHGEAIDWTGVGQLTLVGLGMLMTDIIDNTEPGNIEHFDTEEYDPLHFWK